MQRGLLAEARLIADHGDMRKRHRAAYHINAAAFAIRAIVVNRAVADGQLGPSRTDRAATVDSVAAADIAVGDDHRAVADDGAAIRIVGVGRLAVDYGDIVELQPLGGIDREWAKLVVTVDGEAIAFEADVAVDAFDIAGLGHILRQGDGVGTAGYAGFAETDIAGP